MSLDAHNLIVPQAGLSSEGVLPGGSQSSGPSDASVADMKTRFDRILALQSRAAQSGFSQSGILTPAIPDVAESVPVEAVTDIAPTVFPQAFVTSLADEGLPHAPPEVAVDFPSVVTGPVEMVPTETGLLTVANEVSPVAPQLEAGAEVASAADVLPLMAAQMPITAFKPTDASSDATPKAEPKVPDLDLAAALMAAQLAASEESGEAPEAQAFETDGDLDALLATLPPELAALLQATANGKPAAAKPAPVTDTNSAANTATAKPDDLLALSPDKGAEKTATDPALSAVKDITATAEDAEAAALPATTAASTHATPAQTQASQSDAQALMNTLSNRLNGATAASSASSAAIAQTYVMSNQTADNIAALAAQIHKKMDGKTLRFDMELRPSDMGRVDVRMEINADGKLSAHLSFDSPLAETEFRGRQDELRRQLEQSGFNLEDGSLSFSSRDQNPSSGGDARDQAALKAALKADEASARFSQTEARTDDLMNVPLLTSLLPGFDAVGGRLALNLRV